MCQQELFRILKNEACYVSLPRLGGCPLRLPGKIAADEKQVAEEGHHRQDHDPDEAVAVKHSGFLDRVDLRLRIVAELVYLDHVVEREGEDRRDGAECDGDENEPPTAHVDAIGEP